MKRKFITTIAALLFITTSIFARDFVGKFKVEDDDGAAEIVNSFRDAYFEQLKSLKIRVCLEKTEIDDDSKPATYIKVWRHTSENYPYCFEGKTLVWLEIIYFSDDNTCLRGVKWTNSVSAIFDGCYVDCSYKVYTLKDGIWYTR